MKSNLDSTISCDGRDSDAFDTIYLDSDEWQKLMDVIDREMSKVQKVDRGVTHRDNYWVRFIEKILSSDQSARRWTGFDKRGLDLIWTSFSERWEEMERAEIARRRESKLARAGKRGPRPMADVAADKQNNIPMVRNDPARGSAPGNRCKLEPFYIMVLALIRKYRNESEGTLGDMFGINQSTVSRYLILTDRILAETLPTPEKIMNLIKEIGTAKEFARLFPDDTGESVVIFDGTHVRFARPLKAELRDSMISYKKKYPSGNTVIMTSADGLILGASKTYNGRVHDIAITRDFLEDMGQFGKMLQGKLNNTENQKQQSEQADTENQKQQSEQADTENQKQQSEQADTENQKQQSEQADTENQKQQSEQADTENQKQQSEQADTENQKQQSEQADTENQKQQSEQADTENQKQQSEQADTENQKQQSEQADTENQKQQSEQADIENQTIHFEEKAQASATTVGDCTQTTQNKHLQEESSESTSKETEIRILRGLVALESTKKSEQKRSVLDASRRLEAMHDLERLLGEPPSNKTRVLGDSGFQGLKQDIPAADVHYPFKNSKKMKITPEQKEYNRELSKIRVKVENAICAAKHFRRVSEIYNGSLDEFNKEFNVACGLANLRHMLRTGTYNYWASKLGLPTYDKRR